jgi:hypothetical protein
MVLFVSVICHQKKEAIWNRRTYLTNWLFDPCTYEFTAQFNINFLLKRSIDSLICILFAYMFIVSLYTTVQKHEDQFYALD